SLMLHDLSGGDDPGDWLYYIYQHTLGKSFPHVPEIQLKDSLDAACSVYLQVLKEVCELQKSSDDGTWQSKYPLRFLDANDGEITENPDEYRLFLKAFDSEYIYQMMKLNGELFGHDTLDHVCGVHFLSLYIARQLKELGLPVDLGRVSGAAAGHDIGKYGCRGAQAKRVPYLHYYYTDQWFKKHGIVYIRNIAINHSTWDLEFENLPLESLILIYSDFRVKRKPKGGGSGRMHMYSLEDSFDIVMGKLDNLDQEKESRYRRVFAKLKDFEDYMTHLGVNTDPGPGAETPGSYPKARGYYSLMHGRQVVQHLKYQSIRHSINLMYRLRDEFSLNAMLESARSEKSWKNLREYLRVFEDYSTYLTQKQKLITIKFLYEQLTHPEDDIRRHCSELIGLLIATFDEEYHKEVPPDAALETPDMTSADLLRKFITAYIDPDHKIIPSHRIWIGHGLSVMIGSLFARCRPRYTNDYIKVLCEFYSNDPVKNPRVQLYLLETIKSLPRTCSGDALEQFAGFVIRRLDPSDSSLRLAALDAARSLVPGLGKHSSAFKQLTAVLSQDMQKSRLPAENYLRYQVARLLEPDGKAAEKYRAFCKEDLSRLSDIFLSNLKTATDRVSKRIQVELLLEHALDKGGGNAFYTAMHFCNLIKVSPVEDVRIAAGEALVRLVPGLSLEQRNDVAV
ncbi:MAG: cytidyltransferase, partial [Clostridiales bacterium]|nr:cytidyltransferase [Clostridiales bacterium]